MKFKCMETETLNELRTAIRLFILRSHEAQEKFQEFRINEVRRIIIEDRYFDFLQPKEIFSRREFTIESLMGEMDVTFIDGSGNIRHSPGEIPRFVISGLRMIFDENSDSFQVVDWRDFNLAR